MFGDSQEPRSAVLFRAWFEMHQATGCSMQTFAARLVEHYHASVPEPLRAVTFKVGGDVFRDATTNAQHVARFMNPDATTRMPVDLEEAWVAALGGEYTDRCRRDLARRYGFLGVSISSLAPGAELREASALTGEFGEVLNAMAPALADGRIDEQDLPHLPKLIDQLDNLCAAAVVMRNRAQAVMDASKDA
ncbi:hypothetical protein [uncultured Brevundimonas sp.]|uniref:hypothetical protein n=1 Tax=uncultured Brevundimonas sp. TaxID=213418 RepID=UPI0030EE4A0B|tara:strand:+ start:6659 stop:7231 length:573 start_codon:yes stop_codon:yes gene_type:complete